MKGDYGVLAMLVLCLGALSWLFFDSFTVGAVGGLVMWYLMGRR